MAWPASAKKEIKSPQDRRAPRNLKFSKPLATRHKTFLALHKKNICGWEGVYTMENKDKKTDYQKVVRVGDQKWEIVETTFRIIFLFEICIHYFLERVFKSHLKKSLPPKMPIPTQITI